jgi:hypothetical protein
MKIACSLIFALGAALTAHADFRYTTTTRNPVDTEASQPYKSAQVAGGGAQTTKHYLKGQKMKVDNGDTATIIDFDAQTVTAIDNNQKIYTVTKFSDLGQGLPQSDLEAKVDLKETGQLKTITGYNASEVVITMAIDSPQASRAGMKMQMEVDTWLSPEVPGSEELRAFFQKNQDRFPWASMSSGANPNMQQAMAGLQRKMASMRGVPVLQVIRVKSASNDAQTAQIQQGMQQARAQLEAMAKQGGPQAAAAQQALARMGGMTSGSGALFEITRESSAFSTDAIPDSVFAIPAGYKQK